MDPNVTVLVAVYNGSAYVRPQIDSLLAQRAVNVTIVVRDDGSTDETLTILREYGAAHANVVVHAGPNIGIKNGFLSMLALCPPTADYVAFSDADDVWLPDKLIEAIGVLRTLGPETAPALYSSQVRFVDNDLRDLGLGAPLHRPLSFSNAMVECRASGATSVFNRAALQVLQRYTYEHAVMHDAWVYLVVTAFGKAFFDQRSFILYRQHGGNQTGGHLSRRVRWRRRLHRIDTARQYRMQAASFLAQAEGALSRRHVDMLRRFVRHADGIWNRIGFALRPSVSYQRSRSGVIYRLMVLLGQS